MPGWDNFFVAQVGACAMRAGPVGVYWLILGLLLSYIVALANAWVLIVEINR